MKESTEKQKGQAKESRPRQGGSATTSSEGALARPPSEAHADTEEPYADLEGTTEVEHQEIEEDRREIPPDPPVRAKDSRGKAETVK